MIGELIERKSKAKELSMVDYYNIIDYLLKNGIDKEMKKLFLCLNSFGMTKKEVLNLTLAMRDSGRVLRYNQVVLEKHSTGGIADSTSVVLIPLLATMGYKVVKTTAKSFMFTNGSADRFGSIPGFCCKLSDSEIQNALNLTNACVLSHDGDMCPADKLLYTLREACAIEEDLNLIAASIASKKLASGAKVVLVDIKYGMASIVKNYHSALELAKILKYVFKQNNVKCVIVITNTYQTIGEGVGNAVEVVDALNVLQGRKCLLRDISVLYASEMIAQVNPKLKMNDIKQMVEAVLDSGEAFNRLIELVKVQGGDASVIEQAKLFKPYNSINFVAERDGYVGKINSLLLGELIRRLCEESHDSNIGAVLRVKIGDHVKKGDVVVSFYYKDQEDFERYREAIAGCVRVTDEVVPPMEVVKKVIR